jgi:hypothetical protein
MSAICLNSLHGRIGCVTWQDKLEGGASEMSRLVSENSRQRGLQRHIECTSKQKEGRPSTAPRTRLVQVLSSQHVEIA